MPHENVVETAKSMIRLHGLAATAVAQEHAAELRAQGGGGDLARWEEIHTAIRELRRTMPHGTRRGPT